MKKLLFLLLFVSSVCLGQMHGMVGTVKQSKSFKYIEYVPTDSIVRGVILYLHGLGERGTDINLIKKNEIPKQFEQGLQEPYIVICPQLPLSESSFPKNFLFECMRLLDTYPFDKHVTGLSLGGMGSYGSIIYSYDYKDSAGYFKTMCSVSGKSSDVRYYMYEGTKVRMYHGTSDNTIGIGADRNLYKHLFDLYPNDVTMVEYVGEGHSIWSKAYATDKQGYWNWLYSWTKPKPIEVEESEIVDEVMEIKDGKLVITTDKGTYSLPVTKE